MLLLVHSARSKLICEAVGFWFFWNKVQFFAIQMRWSMRKNSFLCHFCSILFCSLSCPHGCCSSALKRFSLKQFANFSEFHPFISITTKPQFFIFILLRYHSRLDVSLKNEILKFYPLLHALKNQNAKNVIPNVKIFIPAFCLKFVFESQFSCIPFFLEAG